MTSQGAPAFDPATMQDVSVPIHRIITGALVLSLLLFVAALVPHVLVYGVGSLLAALSFDNVPALLGGFVVLLLLHEAIHAVGWIVFGGVPPSQIRFGVDWKTLSPYTHSGVPMPARGYRLGTVLPLIFTGILPAAVGTVSGNGLLTVLGAALVMGAVGDIVVLWIIRHVPGSARVLDHPSNAGCYVLLDGPSVNP